MKTDHFKVDKWTYTIVKRKKNTLTADFICIRYSESFFSSCAFLGFENFQKTRSMFIKDWEEFLLEVFACDPVKLSNNLRKGEQKKQLIKT